VAVLPAPAGARTLREALGRLDAAGITPVDVALRKPTLDEVFLTLTGHTSRSGNCHDRADDRDRDGENPRERAAR